MNRRKFCNTLLAGATGSLVGGISSPWVSQLLAQEARTLNMQLLGYALAIHVPAIAAMTEILPTFSGNTKANITRLSEHRLVTQAMFGGTADIGETDPPTVLAAIEAKANLKMVGKPYNSSSLAIVVNANKISSLEDMINPKLQIAITARGDITNAILVAPLLKRGLDVSKLTILEVAGTGPRVQALLSGRIDATILHFDQIESIAKQGNFKILSKPGVEIPNWITEVWVVRSNWLEKPENERKLVDFLKALVVSFRKANSDFDWYLASYRKYATLKDADRMSADILKPIWETLRGELGAWPDKPTFTAADITAMIPMYKAADAIQGTVKAEDAVEGKYLKQAVAELG